MDMEHNAAGGEYAEMQQSENPSTAGNSDCNEGAASGDTSIDPTLPEDHTIGTEIEGLECFLHPRTDEDHDGKKVLPFNPTSLNKCQEALLVRKECHLKYENCTLPSDCNSRSGYHMECYRKFTALGKVHRSNAYSSSESLPVTENRSTRSSATNDTNRIGIYGTKCFICDQERKKVSGKEQRLVLVLTENFEKNMKKYANILGDEEMLRKISCIDFVAKEVKYHGYCRSAYQQKADLKNGKQAGENSNQSYWHKERHIHAESFEAVKEFVQENIFNLEEVHYLSDLNNLYFSVMQEISDDDFGHSIPDARGLEKKLLNTFADKIQIVKGTTKQGSIVFSSKIPIHTALAKQQENRKNKGVMLRDTALILRRAIFDMPHHPLPEDILPENLKNGTSDVPTEIATFLKYLIGGPDSRRWGSHAKKRRINSISQDLVYAASAGRRIPGKHFQLGIAVKSITGSRKVVEMLNRYGHCVNYHAIEEIETEMFFSANKDKKLTPSDMHCGPERGIGVAFDNFDRFVETQSGKDTLHDTVGIAYEISGPITNQAESVVQEGNEASTSAKESRETSKAPTKKTSRKRRSYDAKGLDVAPYRKKTRMERSKLLSLDDQRRVPSSNMKSKELLAQKVDILWAVDTMLDTEGNTPMCVGWNSLRTENDNETHQIRYLPQLNMSPTSYDVVFETLKRSAQIAQECQREGIVVSFDLAIAKMAMKIQDQESPMFDKVFIALGPFHIEMALFNAFGKYLAESGGPHILNECLVLAACSTKGFLSGKSYKRCKRIHELLALAMERLHLGAFLESSESSSEMSSVLSEYLQNVKGDCGDIKSFPEELDDILEKYLSFAKETSEGKHGKTPQYWKQYIDMIHEYHNLSRSIRVGDIELFIVTLQRIVDYFFAFNQPNYARWLVKYIDNLLQMPVTHPALYEEFQRKWFAIKRTTKNFSRTPIDLTLEQTINADAASQRTGVTALTNSVSARQRWAESHFLRTSVISNVFQEIGLAKKEDITNDLRGQTVKRNNAHVSQIVQGILDCMNPFADVPNPEVLFNISTGKAASEETAVFLLNCRTIGETGKSNFIQECSTDMSQFEKPIKCVPVRTFATDAGRHKVKAKDGKVVAACLMRDLFGSLLRISLQQKIDIAEVMKFPLTPFPLSLSSVDGTMHKSPKSKLMSELEHRVSTTPPETVDVYVIDAAFFLHLFKELPGTFGGVAKFLLKRLLSNNAPCVHFVSDKWVTPSIKDCEREKRATAPATYAITGPSQKRPQNWLLAMRNPFFKQSLITFLLDAWRSDAMSTIFEGKELFANDEDRCYKFSSEGGIVTRSEDGNLFSTHEEADNRMFFHISLLQEAQNVIVRTIDTDCLVIGLGCRTFISSDVRIWLEIGLQSNNTLRYISVDQLYLAIGSSMCKALPAYHAFTGCDYTSSFTRKGKVMPLKKLEKNADCQTALGLLSEVETDGDVEQFLPQISKFVCEMYEKRHLKSTDDARMDIFMSKYELKREDQLISSVQKLDGSMLPPCSQVLRNKVLRTSYVAKLWMSAVSPHPPCASPTEFGWKLEDNCFRIVWFNGKSAPKSLDVMREEFQSDDDSPTSEAEDIANESSEDSEESDEE